MLTVPRRRRRARRRTPDRRRGLGRFGRIDTLVNNAGIFIAKPFTDYTDEDYDAVTGVNLRGFFEVSRSAVAAMLDPRRGRPRRQHLHQPGRSRQLRRCRPRWRR